MSQAQPQHMYAQPPVRSSNTLGLIGFMLTLVGLIGFCLPPLLALGTLGGLLCFFAIFKSPRGLAIFGFILALLETALLAAWIIMFGAFIFLIPALPAYLGSGADMIDIGMKIEEYRAEHDALPSGLDQLSGINMTDAWGNEYVYEFDADADTYRVGTRGRDGRLDSWDDFFMDSDFFRAIGDALKEQFDSFDLDGLQNLDPEQLEQLNQQRQQDIPPPADPPGDDS